jgi:hypothetical protein
MRKPAVPVWLDASGNGPLQLLALEDISEQVGVTPDSPHARDPPGCNQAAMAAGHSLGGLCTGESGHFTATWVTKVTNVRSDGPIIGKIARGECRSYKEVKRRGCSAPC